MWGPTSVAYSTQPGLSWYVDYPLLLLASQDGCGVLYSRNEAFVHAKKLENQAIELVGTGLVTDYLAHFAGRSTMDSFGYGMTRRLTDNIFAQEGASRGDVRVIELGDCFCC